MLKQEYLKQLKKSISSLPKAEINERVNFYSEMIDDLVEEGLSENVKIVSTIVVSVKKTLSVILILTAVSVANFLLIFVLAAELI